LSDQDCSGDVVAGHGGRETNGFGIEGLNNSDDFNDRVNEFLDGGSPGTVCYVGCSSNYFNDFAQGAGFGVDYPPRNDSGPMDALRDVAENPNQPESIAADARAELERRERRAEEGGTAMDDFTHDLDIEGGIAAILKDKCGCCKSVEITIKEDGKADRTETRSCPEK
jgi:hypothetical protein